MKRKWQSSKQLKRSEISKLILFVCLICLTQACGIKGKPLPPVKQPFSTPTVSSSVPLNVESPSTNEATSKNPKKEKAKK